MPNKLTVIDFFCGAGGFSEGFRIAGFDIIMGLDSWQPALITHNANHDLNDEIKNILDYEDIEEINKLPNSDIIIGSPPCVQFSLSNRAGKSNKDLGLRLIEAFLRVVAVKKHQQGSKLKAWLMENVPNSRNYVKEAYSFKDLGLTDWAKSIRKQPDSVAIRVKGSGDILHSNHYGSAQTRKRFVCGEVLPSEKFPYPDGNKNLKVTLNTLYENFPSPNSKTNPREFVLDPNYPNVRLKATELRDHYYDTGVYEIEWKKARDAKINHPYMGKMSFPEDKNKPSRTIMATKSASTRESILYKSEIKRRGNGEFRTPTIREAATIMGFPINYQFYGNESTKWRQVGNAVCVQLSRALAEKIKQELRLETYTPKKPKTNFENFHYLDSPILKSFEKQPARKPNALFRAHTVKTGNMTVDLTNRYKGREGNWYVIAHAGTGTGYTSVPIDKKLQSEAKRILRKRCPEFLSIIQSDKYIKHYNLAQMNKLNAEHGYNSTNPEHPYRIIENITVHIKDAIGSVDDEIIDALQMKMSKIKNKIPLSQIMAIYSLSILIYGK